MTTTTAPTADLSLLRNDEGMVFSGFDRGTWVVSLRPQGDTDLLPAWIEIYGD